MERNFERDYRLAIACAADPALPMAGVAVLLRNGTNGQPPPFAAELARAGIAAIAFDGPPDFQERVREALSGWLETDAAAK